jgi:hypothetical protein
MTQFTLHSHRYGPKPTTPLIPDWINDQEPIQDAPSPVLTPPLNPANEDENNGESENQIGVESENPNLSELPPVNRFNVSQRGFSKAIKTGDYRPLKRVLKNYVSSAIGGPKTAAKRMSRSGVAVSRLGFVLSEIGRSGLGEILTRLNLAQYTNRPVIEVLSALMDHICGTSALLDDAITRQSYADTVTRIIEENPDLDLNQLSEAQVCEMMAVFLEESIVYRLICDIGRSQTVNTADVSNAIRIEEELYQIVSGLIHSIIVPELTISMQDTATLNQAVQRIYEIAFRSIVEN